MVTAVVWTEGNYLFSASDEKNVFKWGNDGQPLSQFVTVDSYPTCMDISAQEVIILGCSDGSFKIVSRGGRVEKSVAAHKGAVTAIKWNHEGNAIVTAGEDGTVKQWSPNGNIRSKLAQTDRAVYSVSFSSDDQSVLYCSGRNLYIKPLQVSSKMLKWVAHDGVVLKVDWNPVTNLIVSGGEDCRYKVWDSYGRLVFSSRQLEYPATSVAWAPSGDYFAVGSFNTLVLCDKTGWTHSRSTTNSGSIMDLRWTIDGTQVGAAGANGSVVFGQVVGKDIHWKNFVISLNENNQITVKDILSDVEVMEELEFGDRVLNFSMSYNHLVVVTSKTCYVYAADNFNTPMVFDLKGSVSHIVQSESYFALVSSINGVQVFSYAGKLVSNPRVKGLKTAFLKRHDISLSSDILVLIDSAKRQNIHILDAKSGSPICDPITHTLDVVYVSLNQSGLINDRKLAFLDNNNDLYIAQTHRPDTYKLSSMVETVSWNDSHDILAAVSDSKLLVWYYPNVVFVDEDLTKRCRFSCDAASLGKNSRFISFIGASCAIRRADGSSQTLGISSFPGQLQSLCQQKNWAMAIRMCRFLKDEVLWACLAASAIYGKDLSTAEVALSAINEVDKLEFIQHVMTIPSPEGRNAELALFRRRPVDAETILLQADLIYRAIDLNIRLFNWDRALDMAVKYKTHVDTVLGHRQRYLASFGRRENNKRFLQYAGQVDVNWETINQKIENELKKETAKYAHSQNQRAIPPASGNIYQSQPPVVSQQPQYAEPQEREEVAVDGREQMQYGVEAGEY